MLRHQNTGTIGAKTLKRLWQGAVCAPYSYYKLLLVTSYFSYTSWLVPAARRPVLAPGPRPTPPSVYKFLGHSSCLNNAFATLGFEKKGLDSVGHNLFCWMVPAWAHDHNLLKSLQGTKFGLLMIQLYQRVATSATLPNIQMLFRFLVTHGAVAW